MGKLLHNMDIQLCFFLVGIYVCVHLFGCQTKSTYFQKFKSSNVFYAHARQMILVTKRPATPPQELAAKRLVYICMYVKAQI